MSQSPRLGSDCQTLKTGRPKRYRWERRLIWQVSRAHWSNWIEPHFRRTWRAGMPFDILDV